MSAHEVRARDKGSVARFLGWFSVGLGTAQVAAPGTLCRLVGAQGDGVGRAVMRAMGVRELTQGIGILVRPRPTGWLWSRVAGDGIDIGLLVVTAVKNDRRRGRTLFGLANVLAVTVPDVLESRRLGRKQGEPRPGTLVRKVVTVNRPRHEVEEAWRSSDELRRRVLDAGASVRFDAAPGGRGTELAVEFRHAPRGGDLGAALEKLRGKDLPTELADELRRLKQRIEVGEIVRSDASPSGHLLADQLRQRAAQPFEEAVQ
jgi:hypothetical protein